MAREKFGNTWWGNEWLKALTHIDYVIGHSSVFGAET